MGNRVGPDGDLIATVNWDGTDLEGGEGEGETIELRTVPDGRRVMVIGPAPYVRWIGFSPMAVAWQGSQRSTPSTSGMPKPAGN